MGLSTLDLIVAAAFLSQVAVRDSTARRSIVTQHPCAFQCRLADLRSEKTRRHLQAARAPSAHWYYLCVLSSTLMYYYTGMPRVC